MRVAGVVLAGGAGRRVGIPKALLRLHTTTFLEAVVDLLSPAAAVVVVLGHEAARVRAEVPLPEQVSVVDNPRPEAGMLSSIWCGLDTAEALGAEAIVLHPVDHPAVERETVQRVLAALERGALVAVPSHQGRRGHPSGFARATWPALRQASPQRGARGVLADHPEWIVHVEGGPGCLAGVDTPADLVRLRQRNRL